MEVTAGVEISGMYHPAQRGDRDTPAVHSWVDPDSIKITGRPDRVAYWFYDSGVSPGRWDEAASLRGAFMHDLAEDLRIRHEETDKAN